jgi:hypothetical protein
MFLLLAAVTLLPLSGCGPHSGLSSLRAGEAAEKSPNGKYWDIGADEWYEFALRDAQEVLALAEKGNAEAKMVAEAQYVLGKLYFGGKGVTQNTTEATKWFQKAAVRQVGTLRTYALYQPLSPSISVPWLRFAGHPNPWRTRCRDYIVHQYCPNRLPPPTISVR